MGLPRGKGKNRWMDQVSQLRLVITVDDYEKALAFYRDALGLPEYAAYAAPNGGRVTLLDAGRATVELADAAQADYIDEVEVGRRVAGRLRIAFEVPDVDEATDRLAAAGADVIARPTRTPWDSLNARLTDLDGVQLTLFQEVGG
jgi:catechol 2,3-dioxygenase-like lactoylglutathione lyase family enzyme